MPLGGELSKGFKMLQKVGRIDFEVIPIEEAEAAIRAGKLDRGLLDANIFMGRIDSKASHYVCLLRRDGVVVGVYHDIIRVDEGDDTLHRDISQWSDSIFSAFANGLYTVLHADSEAPGYIPKTLDELIELLQSIRDSGDFSGFSSSYNLSPDEQLRRDLRINAPEDRQEELFQKAKAKRDRESKEKKPKKRVRVR